MFHMDGRVEDDLKAWQRLQKAQAFLMNGTVTINDYLHVLTEFEFCTGKYLLKVFAQTERGRSEVCAIKRRLTRKLLYEFWLLLPSHLTFCLYAKRRFLITCLLEPRNGNHRVLFSTLFDFFPIR